MFPELISSTQKYFSPSMLKSVICMKRTEEASSKLEVQQV